MATNGKGPSFQLPVIPDAPLPKDASIASPFSAIPSKLEKITSEPSPSKATVATKKQTSKSTLKTKEIHRVPVDSLHRVGSDGKISNKPIMQIPSNGPGSSPAILGAPLSNNTSIASAVPAIPSKKEKAAETPSKSSPSKATVSIKKQIRKAPLKVSSPRATEKTSSPFTEAAELFAKATKTNISLLAAASNNKHQGGEQKLPAKQTLPSNNLNKVNFKGKSNDVPKSRAAAISGVTVPPISGTNDSNMIPLDSAIGPSNSAMIQNQHQQAWLLPGPYRQMTIAHPLPPYIMSLQEQQQKQTAPPPTINPSSPTPIKPRPVGPNSPTLHPPKQQPNRPPPSKQSKQPPPVRSPSSSMTMAHPMSPCTMSLQGQEQKQTASPPTINPSSPTQIKPRYVGPSSPPLHPSKQQPNRPPPPKQSKQPPVRSASSFTSKRKRNSALATTRLRPFYVREEELVQMTTNQIEQAIPENASSVFHVLDRRVNLDASFSKDANMYSLLRSWVQDDPDRQIPPPGADISEQYNSSASIPTRPTPGYEEPIMKDNQCSKETKTTAPTTIPFDMLTALRFQRQLPPKDFVRNEFLARARESRKTQRKTYASRSAAAKASLKRKGIVLPSL
jgi:hypothetical protein